MSLDKLIEVASADSAVPEPTGTEQAVETTGESPASAPDIGTLTGGKFETPEALYSAYSELTSSPKNGEYEFRDDWIKGLVSRYEGGEDLTPYVKAKTTNVDDLSASELLRMDLQKKYPKASATDLDKLYNKHIVAKYGLDGDEDEISVGEIEMGRDAEAIRNEYKKELEQFLQPPVDPKSETQDDKAAAAMEQFKAFEEAIRGAEASQSILSEKRLEIPTIDGEVFNLELDDPDTYLNQAVHADEFYKNFEGKDGPDLSKFFLVAKFAKNPSEVISLLVKHGKELGKAQVLKEIENPSEPARVSSGGEDSPFERLFKSMERK